MMKATLKYVFGYIFFLLFQATTFANTFPASKDSLIIQMGNIGYLHKATSLPLHDFTYQITIPQAEWPSGAPLTGPLTPGGDEVATTINRVDGQNIEADLKIYDPAIGNVIIWQGKITLDKINNQISAQVEHADERQYVIRINIIQPNQGRPQFIIDTM